MSTTTTFCGCCCGSGNQCYQSWLAHWSCNDLAWTFYPGEKTCQPKNSDTAWSVGSASGDGCDYTRLVPMKKCCTVDGDCTGLDDTDTPAAPPSHADCCCTNHCFQTWTAVWSCDDLSWTGPTAGAKTCLSTATSEAWVKTGTDTEAHTCTYTKHVKMPKCCTVDGDCTGEANTATPSTPSHGDCCAALCAYCEVTRFDGYEGGCDPEVTEDCVPIYTVVSTTTPMTWTVTFSDVENAIDFHSGECAYGDPVQGGTGTLGTYTLTQTEGDACSWDYTGTGPSVVVAGVSYSGLYVKLQKVGGLFPGYTLFAALTGSGAVVDPFEFNSGGPDGSTNDGCCMSVMFSNVNTTYDCSAVMINGTAIVTPDCDGSEAGSFATMSEADFANLSEGSFASLLE